MLKYYPPACSQYSHAGQGVQRFEDHEDTDQSKGQRFVWCSLSVHVRHSQGREPGNSSDPTHIASYITLLIYLLMPHPPSPLDHLTVRSDNQVLQVSTKTCH